MSSVFSRVDAVLTALGIPYAYQQYGDPATTQLPDSFIVYFRVASPGETWGDGVQTSRQHRMQISYYTRTASALETVPDQIETAMVAAGFTGGEWMDFPFFKDTGHYGTHADFYYYERRG